MNHNPLTTRQGPLVVALGGNAISPAGERDTIENQFDHTKDTARKLVHLFEQGWEQILVTHGNGPQVGNVLTRVETAREVAPWLPLYICVADTQGGMGYMIQQCLHNAASAAGISRPVVSLVTQVVVDGSDPAFANPTKPIGPQKRLVPSPRPIEIVESDVIASLLRSGAVVIAGGGGGIPVVKTPEGLQGVEAVVDKDATAAIMASAVDATTLVILTDVEGVMHDGRLISSIEARRLGELAASGEFPAGSMGPKVRAAVDFIDGGGELAVIAHLDKLEESLQGSSGTQVRP